MRTANEEPAATKIQISSKNHYLPLPNLQTLSAKIRDVVKNLPIIRITHCLVHIIHVINLATTTQIIPIQ